MFRNDPYKSYYGSRGFDDMDEHIMNDILKLSPKYCAKYSNLLNSCALASLGLIRHESIEPQTSTGFFILARTYGVLFRIGVSLTLFRLGYRMVKAG